MRVSRWVISQEKPLMYNESSDPLKTNNSSLKTLLDPVD